MAIETLVQLYPVSEKLLCSLQIAAKKLAKKYVELCENLSVAFMVLLKNTNERNNFAEMIVEALYLDPCNVATLWDIIAEENYMQTGLVLAYIDENYSSLGICLSKIPAFFEFLNKVRCNSPVYHLADSIVRKLIIDVSRVDLQKDTKVRFSHRFCDFLCTLTILLCNFFILTDVSLYICFTYFVVCTYYRFLC